MSQTAQWIDEALAPIRKVVSEGVQQIGDGFVAAFDKIMTGLVQGGGLAKAFEKTMGAMGKMGDMAKGLVPSDAGKLKAPQHKAPQPLRNIHLAQQAEDHKYNPIDKGLATKIAQDFGIDDSGKGKYGTNNSALSTKFTHTDKRELTGKYGTHASTHEHSGEHTVDSMKQYIQEHKKKQRLTAGNLPGH
jgi:hypothetical protein